MYFECDLCVNDATCPPRVSWPTACCTACGSSRRKPSLPGILTSPSSSSASHCSPSRCAVCVQWRPATVCVRWSTAGCWSSRRSCVTSCWHATTAWRLVPSAYMWLRCAASSVGSMMAPTPLCCLICYSDIRQRATTRRIVTPSCTSVLTCCWIHAIRSRSSLCRPARSLTSSWIVSHFMVGFNYNNALFSR